VRLRRARQIVGENLRLPAGASSATTAGSIAHELPACDDVKALRFVVAWQGMLDSVSVDYHHIGVHAQDGAVRSNVRIHTAPPVRGEVPRTAGIHD
jgi:hypothetical protein